jgi:thioester reductase-like protein
MTSALAPRLVVARQLGLDPDRIDPDRPLASYGLDSLRSLELVAALEDATGHALPESFCFEFPTLSALAGALEGLATDTDTAPWSADLELPADVVVTPGEAARTPRHVLLTGATGLVGGYLLRALADATDAQIWCLVRAAAGQGLARVRANLERYGLWHGALAKRIEIVRGDLSAPRLGLADDEYAGVATITDAVLHAAADVDWVQPYRALRQVNVIGTREVLRIAGARRPKPVQFISSLSVCHIPGGPPMVDETTDCIPFIDRLPLGYAQTKCVAEALCEDAHRRGLPIRVIRPALVAGDSRSGASNADDLVGRLLRGCIDMRAAPDLDWSFDAVPVDELARAVLGAPWPMAGAFERVHVRSPQPRSWQECVLWLNLLGYRCRLMPLPEWRERLRWVGRSSRHPLAPLRSFFADGPEQDSPAERCQTSRHGRVVSSSLSTRAVDAPMLARQIDGYVAAGLLRAANRARTAHAAPPPLWQRPEDLAAILRERLGGDLAVHGVDVADHDATLGIVSDLSSWRRGRQTGVFRVRITLERHCGTTCLPAVIKARAHDVDVIEAARGLANACDEGLEREVRRFEEAIGLRGAGDREVALYQHAPDRLRRFMPACYGAWRQSDDAGPGLIIEDLHGRARLDATTPDAWTPADIRVALEGLAAIHAAGLDGPAGCPGAPMRRPTDVVAMAPLWAALAEHAASTFERAGGPGLAARHAALVETIDRWAPSLEASASTLIHHDFNPRNAAIRTDGTGPALVAYDWELATTGLPQRDLAEFLCFALPHDAAAGRVAELVEGYRRLLEHASARSWPREAWHDGFRAALALLLVDRLAFYAMIARVRPQTFLPGVLRTWRRLDAIATSCARRG